MSQGVYVLGGTCPRGKCPGGICPWGKCLGGTCRGGYVLEPSAILHAHFFQRVVDSICATEANNLKPILHYALDKRFYNLKRSKTRGKMQPAQVFTQCIV